MKTILILVSLFFATFIVSAQNASNCTQQNKFENYLRCVIEDPSKDMKLFPKPPFLTDSVIAGAERESELHDSTRYYLNNLSYYFQRSKLQREQPEQCLNYFFRKDCFYTLLALTVHWAPDTRVYAIRELTQLIRISLVRNDQKLKSGLRFREYKSAKEFLIYVLDNTPWNITGEENATIHHLYIQNILNCLYLLHGEKMPYSDSQVSVYSDEEIRNNLNRWKGQLTK